MTNSVNDNGQVYTHEQVQLHVHNEKYQTVRNIINYVEAEISKNENEFRDMTNSTNDKVIHYYAKKSELLKLKVMLLEEHNRLIAERKHEQFNQLQSDIQMGKDPQWGLSPAK